MNHSLWHSCLRPMIVFIGDISPVLQKDRYQVLSLSSRAHTVGNAQQRSRSVLVTSVYVGLVAETKPGNSRTAIHYSQMECRISVLVTSFCTNMSAAGLQTLSHDLRFAVFDGKLERVEAIFSDCCAVSSQLEEKEINRRVAFFYHCSEKGHPFAGVRNRIVDEGRGLAEKMLQIIDVVSQHRAQRSGIWAGCSLGTGRGLKWA
jgi:hypothetical protein